MSVTRAQVVDALETAWGDFIADTGEHPDCFEVYNHRGTRSYDHALLADFERGNFAQSVADWINRIEREAADA